MIHHGTAVSRLPGSDLGGGRFGFKCFSREPLLQRLCRGRDHGLGGLVGAGDADLLKLYNDIAGIFARFPTGQTPNETQTEDDLIWRVLAFLGWSESLRQQNLTTKGRQEERMTGQMSADTQTTSSAAVIPNALSNAAAAAGASAVTEGTVA